MRPLTVSCVIWLKAGDKGAAQPEKRGTHTPLNRAHTYTYTCASSRKPQALVCWRCHAACGVAGVALPLEERGRSGRCCLARVPPPCGGSRPRPAEDLRGRQRQQSAVRRADVPQAACAAARARAPLCTRLCHAGPQRRGGAEKRVEQRRQRCVTRQGWRQEGHSCGCCRCRRSNHKPRLCPRLSRPWWRLGACGAAAAAAATAAEVRTERACALCAVAGSGGAGCVAAAAAF